MEPRPKKKIYLQDSQRVILAGQHRMESACFRGGETQDVIDLVRAEVVVGIFAVNIVIVDVVPAHKEMVALDRP